MKLLEALNSVIEILETELEKQEVSEAEVATYKRHREAILEILGGVNHIQELRIEQMIEAAEKEGLTLKEWIRATILFALDKTRHIEIDERIFEELDSLARGKSISLRDFTTSVDFTDRLQYLISNRLI